MRKSNQILLSLLAAGSLLFFGILFGSFFLENILRPLALTLWLFLRIFVLSIDQRILWGMMIFIIFLFFTLRLIRTAQTPEQSDPPDTNACINNLEFWRFYLSARPHDSGEKRLLRQKLIQMLISLYASRKRIEADYTVTVAFKTREIPLPDEVYSFLFDDETKKTWRSPRRWMQKLSGREASDYSRDLNETLHFLENFLEIKDEQESIDQNLD
jgi:hypothetical protein